MPHCKRCGLELDQEVTVCPRCHFAPKQIGLRFAGGGMVVLVFSMVIAQLIGTVRPGLSVWLVLLGVIAFACSLVLFVVAMAATPYRLGGLFKRF